MVGCAVDERASALMGKTGLGFYFLAEGLFAVLDIAWRIHGGLMTRFSTTTIVMGEDQKGVKCQD